ncbi:MAG: ABC transporter ATP-binding protein, partial [Magnetococcales bacterium]|nr:ABC transporter ATP-binding protein [Magnetococcales bacterium]
MATPLLEVRDLQVTFHTPEARVAAVRGISFDIAAGENAALVGESGSGKTVAALAILGLLPPSARVTAGALRLGGDDLLALDPATRRLLRGSRAAMVFQEPMTALNPVQTIGAQLVEPLILHRRLTRAQALTRAGELLERTGLPDPGQKLAAYPHQLSGGQRQRVMIAMALACRPDLLVADEPTTALDVTIQAQILALLAELQREMGMALLLITHDLPMVRHLAGRVHVMRAGAIVEAGPTPEVFTNPRHPYTRTLLDSLPPDQPPPRPPAAPVLLEIH